MTNPDPWNISDLYKSVHGFRPSQGWWQMWNALTDGQKEDLYSSMCDELEVQLAREKSVEANRLDLWYARMDQIATERGVPFEEAVHDDILVKCDSDWDIGYYCYTVGIPYKMEDVIKRMLRSLDLKV